MFSSIFHWLIPVAHAVVLDRAGTWTNNGAPNPAISGMWARICTTLPFCGVGPNAPVFFVTKLVSFIFLCISGIAVLMIVYAGIKMVLSQGSEEALGEARKILLYAVAGLILALLARAIMIYVSSILLPQTLA